jgi:uncharacterized protein (TIGR00297 family)
VREHPETLLGHDRRSAELARQLIHIVTGVWAYLLRWLTPGPLMLLALAATAFNLWLLPRIGGRWLWRDHEVAAGRAGGIVLYPLTVFLLLGVFYRRPEVAAAGWGLLAFADGAATVVGKRWGVRGLPWNAGKSWVGFFAYAAAGWIAVFSLISWIVPGRYEIGFLVWVAAAVAVLGAFLESAPQKLDDNLGVPLVASLFLWCCLLTVDGGRSPLDPSFLQGAVMGLAVNIALVGVAYRLRTLDKSGAVVACLLGTLVVAFLSWQGYSILLVFFALGSVSTKIGYAAKARKGVAQGRGGRRRAANALANGGVATACAVFAGLTPFPSVFLLAFACALGAAAADTVESEIGQIWGHPTVLITSFRAVEPGTNGGISVVGTVAGLAAALSTVGAGWLVGLYSSTIVLPLSVLALTATLVESLVGATLERAGWLDNDGVNLVNTLLAALLGAGWGWIMG